MRHAQTWTAAVVRHLTGPENIADTRRTVREWREAYPHDPGEASHQFAMTLAEDLRELYLSCNDQLDADFMELGFRHVNWRRVAEYLLDRFAPLPETQAVVFHALRIPSLN